MLGKPTFMTRSRGSSIARPHKFQRKRDFCMRIQEKWFRGT